MSSPFPAASRRPVSLWRRVGLILALCELQCFVDDARAVHGFEPQDLTVECAAAGSARLND
jgi:hypothetical protein